MRVISYALCVAWAVGMTGPSGAVADDAREGRFVQDRFCISFWVDPPADQNMDAHYKKIAEAHFTVVVGGFGARTPEQVERQLALCEKYGLKAIVARSRLPADKLPTGPALWGYMVRDEPSAAEFPDLTEQVAAIRRERPGKLAFINLFPNYASAGALGTETYDEHVERFAREVDVDVLCMDHYPRMRPDADGRQGYCDNLEVMRRVAQERGIPFWNFFNTMPFGPHFDPTEAQLRWQIYTSLAYGARGVLYFCYWTPVGGHEFPKGGAIITADGRPTRHYAQAQRINARLKNLGPTLMQLTSTGVYRIEPGQNAAEILVDTPIQNLTDGDYLVGVFTHEDGRTAVLLNNYRFAYTAWPTVTFRVDPARITEIDQDTGSEIPLRDDSPAMDGIQISLDSGEGRLFLVDVQ